MMQRPDTEERRRHDEEPDFGPAPRHGRDAERERVGVARHADEELEEISLLELGNVLLKRWKLIVGLPLAAAVVAAVIVLIIPPKFTAVTTFVPESESRGIELPAGLAGLASQFGVSIPGAGAGTSSPAFYADVLASRTLRDAVLLTSFAVPGGEGAESTATLLELLEVEGEDLTDRLEKGRRRLEDATSISVDNETNVVAVRVETEHPELSADVANLYIDLLNRFNLESRQSRAQANRRFIEERLAAAEEELREAEETLKRFLEANRRFESSPDLTFQYERLQRQVTIKQEVFTTLRRSYEEARIQEVNDTPVITVIDQAVPPQEKSSPKRTLTVILAFVLGGVLAVFFAFGQEFVERARERDEEEFEEFSSRWSAIKRELGGVLRRRRGSDQ